MLKLGKAPARKDSIKFLFGNYLTGKLPPPPKQGGHLDLIKNLTWGMLGNDEFGDCVLAGAAHETMLWNAEAKKIIPFYPPQVLSDYSAITGFNPKDPSTDQGTDMQVAAKYRQDVGVLDGQGMRHRIGAYLAISTPTEVRQAIHFFSACGIGIQFPNSAMTQFNAGKDWTVVKKTKVEGGHYIPGIAYDEKFVYVVTWGRVVRAEWAFIKKYMDEAVVYLSEEMLTGGVSLEGINLMQLQADIKEIKGQ